MRSRLDIDKVIKQNGALENEHLLNGSIAWTECEMALLEK